MRRDLIKRIKMGVLSTSLIMTLAIPNAYAMIQHYGLAGIMADTFVRKKIVEYEIKLQEMYGIKPVITERFELNLFKVSRLVGNPIFDFDIDNDGKPDISTIINGFGTKNCYVREGFEKSIEIFGQPDKKYCNDRINGLTIKSSF